MLTARASLEARQEGRAAGADVYMAKPVGLAALADQIEELLDAPTGG